MVVQPVQYGPIRNENNVQQHRANQTCQQFHQNLQMQAPSVPPVDRHALQLGYARNCTVNNIYPFSASSVYSQPSTIYTQPSLLQRNRIPNVNTTPMINFQTPNMAIPLHPTPNLYFQNHMQFNPSTRIDAARVICQRPRDSQQIIYRRTVPVSAITSGQAGGENSLREQMTNNINRHLTYNNTAQSNRQHTNPTTATVQAHRQPINSTIATQSAYGHSSQHHHIPFATPHSAHRQSPIPQSSVSTQVFYFIKSKF